MTRPLLPPFEKLGGETAGWCPTFTGDSTDWVGSSDGTESGGVSIVRDREKGGIQCWEFDGVDGVVDTGVNLLDGLTAFSATCWFQRGNTGTQPLLQQYVLSGDRILSLHTDLGALKAVVSQADGTTVVLTATSSISQDTWYHAAVTYDGSTVRLYVDGVEEATSATLSGALDTCTATFKLGKRDSASPIYLEGKLDDVRVWTGRAIAAAEVKELYKRGYQRHLAGKLFNPHLHWSANRTKFNNAVSHVSDLSGNDNWSDPNAITEQASVGTGDSKPPKEFFFEDSSLSHISKQLDITSWASITVLIRCRIRASLNQSKRVFSIRHTAGDDIRFFLNGTSSHIGLDDGNATTITLTPAPVDEWATYALSFDGTTLRVYKDGTEVGNASASFNFSTADGLCRVGGDADGSGYSDIALDEFLIWDSALTANEIRLLARYDSEYIEPEDGLVAWYCPSQDPGSVSSSGNPLDLTLAGNNGTIQGGVGYDETDFGKSGKAAFEFTGATTQKIQLPNFAIGSGNKLTVSAWVNATSTADRYIFHAYGNPANNLIYLFKIGGVFRAYARDSSGNQLIATGTVPASLNTWFHVSLVLNGNNIKLYVDGALDAQDTNASFGTVDISAGTVPCIGAFSADGVTGIWAGLIDNVKIYNRDLLPREIQKQYAMERPGVPMSYNSFFGEGLNTELIYPGSHWPMQADVSDWSTSGTVVDTENALTVSTGPNNYLTQARDFDGSGSYLFIGSDGNNDLDVNDGLLLSAWVNPDTVAGGTTFSTTNPKYVASCHQGSDLNTSRYLLRILGSAIDFLYSTSSSAYSVTRSVQGVVTANEWQHIAAIADDEYGVRLFRNGVEVSGYDSQQAAPLPAIYTTAANPDLRIGYQAGNTRYFDGDVCELVVARLNFNDSLKLLESLNSGPAPIFTGSVLPAFTATPTEGVEGAVSTGTWGLDPRWGAGTNGTPTFYLWWYLADDDLGTNETLVDITEDPIGYTFASGDVGKYCRVMVEAVNNGGSDEREVWFTDYAAVQAASSGGVTVTMGVGVASGVGHAPTVTVAGSVSPAMGLGVGSGLGLQPSVLIGTSVSPVMGVGAASGVGHALTVSVGNGVSPAMGAGFGSGQGQQPETALGVTVIIGAGVASGTGLSPSVTLGGNVSPAMGVGSGSGAGFSPTTLRGHSVTCGAGAGSGVGYAMSVLVGGNIAPVMGAGVGEGRGRQPGLAVGVAVSLGVGSASGRGNVMGVAVTGGDDILVTVGAGAGAGVGYSPETAVSTAVIDDALRVDDLRFDELEWNKVLIG